VSRVCKKCGNVLKDTSKFCSKCGTPYVDEPNTQESGKPTANLPPQAPPPSGHSQVSSVSSNNESGNKSFLSKLFKWVVIIGIVLFAFNAFCGNNSDEKKTADNSNKTATNAAEINKTFLGKWNGLKPGSSNTTTPNSITIKEANPQTGGYEVEIFFYRIADAKGYANIDGNKLSINKGIINNSDKFKFRGTIEKTNSGIRLNITESGFEYIKPGSVYEYKKSQ